MSPRRAVMVVGNAFAPDNRVRKSAATMREAGWDVTVIALAEAHHPDQPEFHEVRDGISLIHVQVPFRHRDAANQQLARQAGRPTIDLTSRRAKALTEDLDLKRQIALGDAAVPRTGEAAMRRALRRTQDKAAIAGIELSGYSIRLRRRLGRTKADGSLKMLPKMRAKAQMTRATTRPETYFPEVLDYERSFRPVLERLDADVIHANDVYMLGLVAREVGRRRQRGETVGLLYDAHEYTPGLGNYTQFRVAAMVAHEEAYLPAADKVVTVAQSIAEQMQKDHGLREVPAVVHNTPFASAANGTVSPTLRERLGLGPDVPIVVYSGNVGNLRGENTLVQALAHLRPEIHVVLVTNATERYMAQHWATAEAANATERLHQTGYVPAAEVVPYLRDATVGYHGLVPGPLNHEMALPNKLYEYMHAGLPLVVSEAHALKTFVESNGIGLSFHTDDPAHLAAQIHAVIDDRATFTAPVAPGSELLKTYCWEHDGAVLRETYEQIMANLP